MGASVAQPKTILNPRCGLRDDWGQFAVVTALRDSGHQDAPRGTIGAGRSVAAVAVAIGRGAGHL
jgi:hypothetical protein